MVQEMDQATKDAMLDMAHVLSCKEVYDNVVAAFPINLGKATSKKEREVGLWVEYALTFACFTLHPCFFLLHY